MRRLLAALPLVAARARRRPGRWLLPALGIALAAAFAAVVAAEGAMAGDQSARSVLAGLSPLERTVRVTWGGPAGPGVAQQAHGLLDRLGLSAQTEVVLLNPVRLGGVVVRPAAISPLRRWLPAAKADSLGPCLLRNCPMLLAAGRGVPPSLSAIGVRIRLVGSAVLRSAVPLSFAPATGAEAPVLVTGDTVGLNRLAGLSGVLRTYSWLAPLSTDRLHSWELAPIESRLRRAQSALLASGSLFSVSAPFTGLDEARTQARAAPRRMLLAGGGAVAALALFVVLAAAGLRRDQRAELDRLRNAGARVSQCAVFVAGECGWLSGAALLAGTGIGVVGAAVLAHANGEPAGRVLTHSLVTPTGALVLVGAWLLATVVMTLAALVSGPRVVDALAIAAISALAAGLALGTSRGDRLAALLAPLCCLAAGVLTVRAAAALFRSLERLVRCGPVLARLAIVGLARAPALPSLAVAFVAVSVGLGGFALSYRATLVRGAADQAADRVPLDAVVSPSPTFATPLELAPLSRWRAIASGPVLPVRRTEANYTSGGGTITVPALGVPADGLALIHGWRTSDGSAPLPVLARRLRPPGPVRVPGPELPAGARALWLHASSPALDVSVTADLRRPDGTIRQLSLGTAIGRGAVLRAPLPRGRWEVEALELDEPVGLAVTNGHQNGENPGAATLFQAPVALGPLRALTRAGRALISVPLGSWRAIGAAASSRSSATLSPEATVSFVTSGVPGLLRPAQPSDTRPVPVLADPQTAAAASPGGRLAMTVDGYPVVAKVVGTLRRFPTLPADAGGIVVGDEATLASALDAQLPGQGRPDELWISTAHPARLRAALQSGRLAQLAAAFRADVQRRLRSQPIAGGVLGTLIAAAVLSAALAVLGLLTALLGGGRDRRVERDLDEQGIGPRGLRAEARTRLALAGALGVAAGTAIAVALTGLAVAGVRAAGTVSTPRPPLVTVLPWAELAAWSAGVLALLVLAGWLGTRAAIGGSGSRSRSAALAPEAGAAVPEGVAR